jgi:phosphate-selective porin OprO/OprP
VSTRIAFSSSARFALLTCGGVLAWLLAAVPGRAQDAPQAEPTATAKKAKPRENKKHRAKHPSLTLGDALTLDVAARIERDVRGATPAIGLDRAQGEWGDRRLGIQGTAFKRVDFEVSREFGKNYETVTGLSEKTAWRDVYADVRVMKGVAVEAGQFKLPFGHEELVGEPNLDFVYRSLATRVLSPGRDPGVMVHGRLLARRLTYQAGYFTRDGSNGRTSQTLGGDDARVARLVVAPFATTRFRAMAPLEIGAAVADSRIDNRLGIRGRTVLGDDVFFDRLYVNGRRDRIGAEAAWARGPVGLSTEYIKLTEERRGMGFSGADLPSVTASGWYAAGTWALTGERKHGRLEPRRDLLRGGAGAVELAARVEALRFHSSPYPTTEFGFPAASKLVANADHVTTLGINWYLNRYIKLQAGHIRESIDDPARSPAAAAGGRFVSTVLRIQFRL